MGGRKAGVLIVDMCLHCSLIIEIFENKNTYVYILMRGTPSSFLYFGLVGIGCQEDVVVERIAAGTPSNEECSFHSLL